MFLRSALQIKILQANHSAPTNTNYADDARRSRASDDVFAEIQKKSMFFGGTTKVCLPKGESVYICIKIMARMGDAPVH